MTPSQDARTPPRYVPTLTEVVNVPQGVLPRPEAVLLSDVVPPQALPVEQEALAEPISSPPPNAAPVLVDHLADDWAEQITQRVLERLEQRLCLLLEEQSAEMARGLAQAVALRLRSELPGLVQQAVHSWPAPSDTPPAHEQ